MIGRRYAVASGLIALLFFAFLLGRPAQADFFKWVDDQFEGDADAPRISLVEPGLWAPAVEESTLSTDERGGQRARERFLSDEEKSYESRYEPAAGGRGGQTVVSEGVTVLTDGLTALRQQSSGLVPDRRLKAYLDGIAGRLMVYSPKTNVPYDVHITGSRAIGSAQALQDGVIGIPLGVLQVAETEDELAFLIGHELSHVILGHHDSDWVAKHNKRIVSVAEIGIQASFDVAQRFGANLNENEIRWLSFAASQASLFLSDNLLSSSWSREHETEADELGLDLMIAAGYDPEGAFILLERMQIWEEMMPSAEERHAQQRAAFDEKIGARGRSGDTTGALQGILERGLFEIKGLGEAIGGEDHPDIGERIDHIADYFGRFYAESIGVRSSRDGEWKALRNSSTTTALIQNYDTTWHITELLEAGEIDQAAGLAGRAVSGPTKSHALPRMNFARVRKFQGNTGKARANLRLGLDGDEPNLKLYKWAVIDDLNNNKRVSAFRMLDDAWTRFKQPPELYPLKIYKAVLQDDRQEASRLTRTCRIIFRDNSKPCLAANNGELDMSWN